MNKKLKILDTTLRDGSYAINFSFSAQDTAIICKALEEAGIEYIEIGHGVGFNGSQNHGKALQSDAEYLEAAAGALEKAKFGMFCIPGIADLSHIDLAAEYDMKFIRIGTDVTHVKDSQVFIEKAKKKGMFVAANFMKSYALSPKEFAANAKLSESYGADMVYVVDSSGGMFPNDIREYYQAIRDVSDISLGFHGHNNLHLAIANTLEAINLGYDFVDTSLQGMGRSAGNASTEILVATLIKMGMEVDIDLLKILETSNTYVNPLISSKGIHPLDVIAGYADFHSSYMGLIHKYSAKYSVHPAILITEITKINKVDVDEEVLEEIAQKLEKKTDLFIGKYQFNRYIGNEQSR